MPFRPGPGVGGHCIPDDSYYLAWRARQFEFVDRFVEPAGDINMSMPQHVVDLVAEALNSRGQALNGSRVGVVGPAFKPIVRDPRNSPAAEVIAMLRGRSAAVHYHDPYIPRFTSADVVELHSQPLATLLDASDVIVALAHHSWRRLGARLRARRARRRYRGFLAWSRHPREPSPASRSRLDAARPAPA